MMFSLHMLDLFFFYTRITKIGNFYGTYKNIYYICNMSVFTVYYKDKITTEKGKYAVSFHW
jgi:hypothetical protein